MNTLYYNGMIHDTTLLNGTDKAFYVDIDNGRWSAAGNKKLWIAKSICEIGKANELGWHKISIPRWLFAKNKIDYKRILDIDFD